MSAEVAFSADGRCQYRLVDTRDELGHRVWVTYDRDDAELGAWQGVLHIEDEEDFPVGVAAIDVLRAHLEMRGRVTA